MNRTLKSIVIIVVATAMTWSVALYFKSNDDYEDRSSSTEYGDKKIVVYGGSSQSIEPIKNGQKVVVDNNTITVIGDQLSVNGTARSIVGYKLLTIKLSKSGRLSVSVK